MEVLPRTVGKASTGSMFPHPSWKVGKVAVTKLLKIGLSLIIVEGDTVVTGGWDQ